VTRLICDLNTIIDDAPSAAASVTLTVEQPRPSHGLAAVVVPDPVTMAADARGVATFTDVDPGPVTVAISWTHAGTARSRVWRDLYVPDVESVTLGRMISGETVYRPQAVARAEDAAERAEHFYHEAAALGGLPGPPGDDGDDGLDGHSPVLTWEGDRIAIDGVATGPSLTGPASGTETTGWRKIHDAVWLRRTGNRVDLHLLLNTSLITSGATNFMVPVGFVPESPTNMLNTPFTVPAAKETEWYGLFHIRISSSGSSNSSARGVPFPIPGAPVPSSTYIPVYLSWTTADAWPATLPGTPV